VRSGSLNGRSCERRWRCWARRPFGQDPNQFDRCDLDCGAGGEAACRRRSAAASTPVSRLVVSFGGRGGKSFNVIADHVRLGLGTVRCLDTTVHAHCRLIEDTYQAILAAALRRREAKVRYRLHCTNPHSQTTPPSTAWLEEGP